MKKCPSCGAPVSGGRGFCEKCGGSLQGQGDRAPARRPTQEADSPAARPASRGKPPQKSSNKRVLALVAGGVLLVLAVSLLLVNILSRPAAQEADSRSFPVLSYGEGGGEAVAPAVAADLQPGLFICEKNENYVAGYEPALRLDAGGSFSFEVNLGTGMNVVTGRYVLLEGSLVLDELVFGFQPGETPPQTLVFEISDENTLIYGAENPAFGMTEPGGVYRRGERGAQSLREEFNRTLVTGSNETDHIAKTQNGFFEAYPLMTAGALLGAGGFDEWSSVPTAFEDEYEVLVMNPEGAAFVFAVDGFSGSCTLDRLVAGETAVSGSFIGPVLGEWFAACYQNTPPATLPYAPFDGAVSALPALPTDIERVQNAQLQAWPGVSIKALADAGGLTLWNERTLENGLKEISASDGNEIIAFALDVEANSCVLSSYSKMGGLVTGDFLGAILPNVLDTLYQTASAAE